MDPPIRLLLVEDHTATRHGYATYLEAQGYDVVQAATGQEALTLANTSKVEVILLDLGLPDINGWEVARDLKASPATAHIPIIALTGAVLSHERASALAAGCDRHVAKPCDPVRLLDEIQLALAARQQDVTELVK